MAILKATRERGKRVVKQLRENMVRSFIARLDEKVEKPAQETLKMTQSVPEWRVERVALSEVS